jgi:thiamine-monophosphate kinase
MPGEFDFIDWIRSQVARSERVIVPPGDDLAVLKWSANDLLIVGVDQVLDGVHFDSSIHSPHDIGRKVMNRNLSDCAAMACLPAAAVATVALPKSRDIEYAKQLFLGMKSAADAFAFPIVGGDTASWDGKLVMTVTILGRSAGIAPVTRGGASAGDLIYVTGPLGGSMRGRHMTFIPRVREARGLADCGVTAMIDLSDGLSRDLRHIARESHLCAALWASNIPIHEDAIEMRRDGHSPLEHALHDGEDYELLFTAPIGAEISFPAIGSMESGEGVVLIEGNRRTALDPKSWEHRF